MLQSQIVTPAQRTQVRQVTSPTTLIPKKKRGAPPSTSTWQLHVQVIGPAVCECIENVCYWKWYFARGAQTRSSPIIATNCERKLCYNVSKVEQTWCSVPRVCREGVMLPTNTSPFSQLLPFLLVSVHENATRLHRRFSFFCTIVAWEHLPLEGCFSFKCRWESWSRERRVCTMPRDRSEFSSSLSFSSFFLSPSLFSLCFLLSISRLSRIV